MKKGLLRDVFGKQRHYPSRLENAFRESFPGGWRFVRNFNRNDHAALLCKLQNVESDLVIIRVGQRLQQLGCTGCISLHDAIYCSQNDLGNVRRAFCEVFASMDIRLRLDERS